MGKNETISHKSSTIKESVYDYDDLKLSIKFKSGAIYTYEDVEEDVYKDFKDSESKGAFLAKKIKGNYEFKKQEDEDNTKEQA
tara:strand:- start:1594 stop:1842 length:249 start_codon:yes stop_codon:yes gene_type:complete